MNPDPLQSLLVDETSIARDELAAALQPFVQLGRDSGLWLLDPFDDLSARNKVLCLLLTVKAQRMLDLRPEDAAEPQELIELSGMAGGTVRPKLTELRKARLVAKGDVGYRIPDATARRALSEFRGARS